MPLILSTALLAIATNPSMEPLFQFTVAPDARVSPSCSTLPPLTVSTPLETTANGPLTVQLSRFNVPLTMLLPSSVWSFKARLLIDPF